MKEDYFFNYCPKENDQTLLKHKLLEHSLVLLSVSYCGWSDIFILNN